MLGRLSNKWNTWWMLSSFWKQPVLSGVQLIIAVTPAKITLKNPMYSSEKWVHQESMDCCFKPKRRYFCAKTVLLIIYKLFRREASKKTATSKMMPFVELVGGFQPLNVTKTSISEVAGALDLPLEHCNGF